MDPSHEGVPRERDDGRSPGLQAGERKPRNPGAGFMVFGQRKAPFITAAVLLRRLDTNHPDTTPCHPDAQRGIRGCFIFMVIPKQSIAHRGIRPETSDQMKWVPHTKGSRASGTTVEAPAFRPGKGSHKIQAFRPGNPPAHWPAIDRSAIPLNLRSETRPHRLRKTPWFVQTGRRVTV